MRRDARPSCLEDDAQGEELAVLREREADDLQNVLLAQKARLEPVGLA